jgi:hypothetical protein
MATENATTSRRAVIAALAGTPLLVGTFAAGIGEAAASPAVDRTAWDRVFASYQRARARFDALCARWEAEDEARGEALPERVDRYFDDYRLGMGMNRETVLFWLRIYASNPAHSLDVEATADEFMEYQRLNAEISSRFRVDELYQEMSDYLPAFNEARNAMMEVPAPDKAALLVKIENASISLCEDHAEATLADARRLLADA